MNPSKLPISVCIIAGNEAHRITPALQSVVEWAAEIVVVLNEDVNDGTDKIVESFGGKVFREPWKGHIAQKNSAAEKASQSWLLGLDADEVISAPLAGEIRRVLSASNDYAAYCFPRCTQFCGRWIRHGDWYPDRQTRLWRRVQARWGGVDPHDKLLVQGRVGRLHSDLEHHSMESVEHQIQKTIRYANDFVADCRKNGRTVSVLDLFLRPPWRFIRGYVLKLGFLDGWQGLSIAWMTAFYTFLRYFKAFESSLGKKSSE